MGTWAFAMRPWAQPQHCKLAPAVTTFQNSSETLIHSREIKGAIKEHKRVKEGTIKGKENRSYIDLVKKCFIAIVACKSVLVTQE